MQVACPFCLTRNRVPEERLADDPRCGSCKQPLLPAAPVAVRGDDLPKLAAGSDVPVVADFWADWCGPCKMMAPAFAQAARERPGIQFVKVDTEASPDVSAQYGIRGIPTMIVFHGGGERARISGAMGAPQLVAWIDQHLRGR
jgi:thioredoxin 2